MSDFISVLEPLCRATQTLLQAVPLSKIDHLHIDLDEKGKKFITQSTAYALANGQDVDEIVEINGERKVRLTNQGSYAASHMWQKRIPERVNMGWGKWAFAATDFTAIVISHVWPMDRLVFQSEEAELLFKFLLARFYHQNKAARLAAEFKLKNETPEMPDDFVEHPILPLSNYQKTALMFCLEQEASALLMEQGTGKTPVVINRICLEAARKRAGRLPGVPEGGKKKMYRALIMCPKHIRANWENEFKRFATVPGKMTVLRGDIINRQKELIRAVIDEPDCAWSAAIISTDSVKNTWKAISIVPWDLCILDESHYIADPRSKRSKAIRQLNNTGARQRMILTGTFIRNTIMDGWSQLEYLGEGLSGFSTFPNYRGCYGKFENKGRVGGTTVQKLVAAKNIPLFQERLSRLAFMITKKEANLQLPEKVYDIDEVEMTSKQTEIYKKLATQLVVEIEEMLTDETITVDHILTKLLRLAQVTSGYVTFDGAIDPQTKKKVAPDKIQQIPPNNPKIDRIIEILREQDEVDPLCKTVIWCCFKEDIRALSERLYKENILHTGYHSPEIVKEYRKKDPFEACRELNTNDKCKVFIGNPKSAKEGLNLLGYDPENPDRSEMYTGHEIYMSSNWSMVERAQSEDRCHRRGTRSNVRITDLMVPGTIDEEIRARVLLKKDQAMMLQDIKNILKKLV